VTQKTDFWTNVEKSKIFKDKEGQKVFDMSAFETAMNDKKVATRTQTAAKAIVRGFLTPEVDVSAWTVKFLWILPSWGWRVKFDVGMTGKDFFVSSSALSKIVKLSPPGSSWLSLRVRSESLTVSQDKSIDPAGDGKLQENPAWLGFRTKFMGKAEAAGLEVVLSAAQVKFFKEQIVDWHLGNVVEGCRTNSGGKLTKAAFEQEFQGEPNFSDLDRQFAWGLFVAGMTN